MKYTIYELLTGRIERVVACVARDLPLQFDPGVSACLEGDFQDDGFYVEAGVPVEKPARPSEHHVFDYAEKKWKDTRTVDSEWTLVRLRRSRLLMASDWVVVKATETGAPVPQVWQDYRQALRDVTMQPDPFNISWPAQP